MSATQFNVTYDQSEDRILLRMNNNNDEEIRCWFTRRLTVLLLTDFKDKTVKYRLLQKPQQEASEVDPEEASKPKLAEVKEQKVKAYFEQKILASETDFSKEFVTGKSFPFTEKGQLIQQVNFSPDKKGQQHKLRFVPVQDLETAVIVALNSRDLNVFFEIMERVAIQVKWLEENLLEHFTSQTLQ